MTKYMKQKVKITSRFPLKSALIGSVLPKNLLLGFILKTNFGAYSLNYIMGWGYREKSVFARPSSVPYLLLYILGKLVKSYIE